MLAQLTAYVINNSVRAPEKPIDIKTFMPSMRDEVPQVSQRHKDGAAMKAWIDKLKAEGMFLSAKSED